MTASQLPAYVLLSAQRALLGVITPNIRMISLQWEGFNRLSLRVHYDSVPTEEQLEDMEVVVAEIIADVPFQWASPVDVVISDAPMAELKPMNRLVFCRKESTDPNKLA